MRQTLIFVLMPFIALSCAAQHKAKDFRIPIVKFNPE